MLRGLARTQQGDRTAALADSDWVLEKMPDGVDLEAIRALRRLGRGR